MTTARVPAVQGEGEVGGHDEAPRTRGHQERGPETGGTGGHVGDDDYADADADFGERGQAQERAVAGIVDEPP